MQRKKSLKANKAAKKNLKKALNATMGMPTSCTTCSLDFDPTKDAETWMVAVFNESIQLNCPECYQKLSEIE